MISIVIIGKNEASNLKILYNSINKINIAKEIIYVDSSSKDESVKISKEFCDNIFIIKESEQNCAAAGRNIGTLESSYGWILYLDGDMELEDEFIYFINSMQFLRYDKFIAGFIGYYKYYYCDGSNTSNVLLQPKNKIVSNIGGAVLLKKEIVIQSNNWNPSVVANEEIDLYMRIQNIGYKVFGLDQNMVKHIAKKESNFKTLLGLIYPMEKKYYGYGQALVSQYKYKTLLSFIKYKPYPILYLIFIVLSIFSLYSIIPLISLFSYITYTKKIHYNIIYITDIVRGVVGLLTYKNYLPIWNKYK